MRILELTNFSAGACGVWNRVKNESLELAKRGHNVKVFSSRFIKGSDKLAPIREDLDGIEIYRFSAKILGGESFMLWNFRSAWKEAVKFNPGLIICHSYRHSHTLFGLRLAKKLGCRVFLITHAPFIEGNKTRSISSALMTRFYDFTIGPATINRFDKVIAVTKWEIPHLQKLGLRKQKLAYSPNGIPQEFIEAKKKKGSKYKILFFGRVSPIKNIETLIRAAHILNNKKVTLEIVGPSEENYKKKLENMVSGLGIKWQVRFRGPIYLNSKKIDEINSAGIFVLPSRSEAMPQALIEAMSLGKIVISSDTNGGKEIIKDGKNGFLFKIGDPKDLARKVDHVIKNFDRLENIRKAAVSSTEKLSWSNIAEGLERIYSE